MSEPIVVEYMVVPEDDQDRPLAIGVKTSFVLVDPDLLEVTNEGGFFVPVPEGVVVHHIGIYALPENGGAPIAKVAVPGEWGSDAPAD